MMGDLQISEYVNRQLVYETVLSHPALERITVRGFVLSENRQECVIFAPVGEAKP
jgi:hypothetical protein